MSDREEVLHRITIEGSELSMASAGPPLKRMIAAKLLVEFLDRVEQVRDEPKWCFKVDKVVLFGSFMTDTPTLGDIDLANALRPTPPSASDRAGESPRRTNAKKPKTLAGGSRTTWHTPQGREARNRAAPLEV